MQNTNIDAGKALDLARGDSEYDSLFISATSRCGAIEGPVATLDQRTDGAKPLRKEHPYERE
jgi:hypothetical protein